jgi:polysaccharide biosynthesis/export protein
MSEDCARVDSAPLVIGITENSNQGRKPAMARKVSIQATHAAGVRAFAAGVTLLCWLGSLVSMSAQQSAASPPSSPSSQPPVALSGSVQSGADPSPTDDEEARTLWSSGRYRLTPNDVIELRFPYVPEFDQTVVVQPDGYVSLRGADDLRVQGRTLPQLRALIVEAYQATLREPIVNIVLKEFEKPYFLVAGEVARPGKYELRGATTLTHALAMAGGSTSSAKTSDVVLFRRFLAEWLEVKQIDVKKMYASRDLSEDPVLQPGDTVFVPKSTLSKIAPLIPRAGIGLYLNPFSR